MLLKSKNIQLDCPMPSINWDYKPGQHNFQQPYQQAQPQQLSKYMQKQVYLKQQQELAQKAHLTNQPYDSFQVSSHQNHQPNQVIDFQVKSSPGQLVFQKCLSEEILKRNKDASITEI